MNYHKFNYVTYKKTSSNSSSPRGLANIPMAAYDSSLPLSSLGRCPIRVTPSALPSLLYTILYVIEFHAPVAPHPAPPQRSLRTGRSPSNNPSTSLAAALPAATAVFSAVRSFFGKTTTPGVNNNSIHVDSIRGTDGFPDISQAADAAQDEGLSALRRVHEQPFVVPVTQSIHKLGDINIVVCETHNPTIAPAYERVLKEITAIVDRSRREQSERCGRAQGYRTSVCSPTSSSSNRISSGASFIATVASPSTAGDHNSRLTVCDSLSVGAAGLQEGDHCPLRLPQGGPSGSQPSSAVIPSPVALQRQQQRYASFRSARSCGGKATSIHSPAFRLQANEVMLEIAIRLSVNEVRWHVPQTRPLAEWTFLVIQTGDENTVIQTYEWTSTKDNGGVDEAGRQRLTSDGGRLTFINDPSQVEDVIQFISKTFYDTINMETFSDFTSGELVFDAQARRCPSFA